MGKKSKTKKAVRELIEKHEKAKPLAKEERKNLKKKIKNELDSPQILPKENLNKPKNRVQKSVKKTVGKVKRHTPKIKSALIVIVSGLLLLLLSWLVILRAFGPTPVAKLLPADSTVALLELNIDKGNSQVAFLSKLLSKKNIDTEDLFTKVSDLLKINFKTQIKPWMGRKAALALINNKQSAEYYWFFEIGNRKVFDKFLETYPLGNNGIGQIDSNYFFPLENYFVLAANVESLKFLKTKSSEDSLFQNKKFRRIDDNLPLSRLGFYYLNFDQVNEKSLKRIPFFGDKGISPEILAGTKQLFNADGGAIIALKDRIAVQNFLSIKKDDYSNVPTTFNPKYRAKLMSYAPENVLVYWGGTNLKEQIGRVIEVVSARNKNKNHLLTDVFSNYIFRNFGPDVLIEKDIFPLFKNEFAFTLEKNRKNLFYKVIIQTSSPSDGEKINILTNNFVDIAASFTPTVVDYTLPDGTYSRELVATKEQINEQQITYKNRKITAKLLSKNNIGIYYTMLNDVAVITTDLDGLKQTIDIVSEGRKNLKSSPVYHEQIVPILNSSDEISMFNLSQLNSEIFSSSTSILSNIKYFTTGNNYFYDGITSISTFTLNF